MTAASNGRHSIADQLRTARDEMMSMRGEAAGIASELQQLMRMEMELARAEVQEAKGHAVLGSAFGAIAALLGVITLIFLFLAIMFAIDTALPLWAAALITTGIAAVIGAIFALLTKGQMGQFSPVPKRAIRTMQEDVQWAKSQLRSNKT